MTSDGRLKAARMAGLALATLILNTVALYLVLTSRGHFIIWDIHPTLLAAQAVWQGRDPYSAEVTAAIRLQLYGDQPTRPIENGFFYPAYVAYLAVPLGLLPLPWAQAVWLSVLEACVVAGAGLIVRTWDWPRAGLGRRLIFAFCALFYPVVWAFVLGQIALVVFALLALAVWAVHRHRDGLGGAALGLSIFKPQLVFLVVPGVILWALVRRRWRLAVAALTTIVLLLALPTVFDRNWISEFIQRLKEYPESNPFTAPAIVAVERCCAQWGLAGWLGPLVVAGFLSAVVYGWWVAARGGRDADFLWAVGMTLIAVTSIAPRISIVNQVVLLLPICGLLKMLASKGRVGTAVAFGLLILWGGGLWLLSWLPPVATAQLRYPVEHRVLSPVVPISLALIWLAGRKALTEPPTASGTAGASSVTRVGGGVS